MRAIFLVDNGSLRPQATHSLRRVAAALSETLGETVQAASLLHSNKIPAEEVDGIPAITLGPAAERSAEAGATEIIVLPFFFGPSKALTGYLPERMAALQARFLNVSVRVAQPLVDELGNNDLRLAALLADHVRAQLPDRQAARVTLVDHGSPLPEVTAVRNRLAGQLSALLADDVRCVAAASMERRDGDEYRFNEPLLERLLDTPEFSSGHVVLAMLFLSPGRHAGEGGDIAEICAAAEQRHPGLRVRPTALVGEHPAIVDILATRLRQALDGERFLLEMPAQPPNA
ncbi:MAG: cobalamin biosynthesis protein CbiX [Halomonas sp.]|uniref:Sirohydrochlorin ferrochelatase n=1 Tax=Vreelandella aquamarina TaxID=77097 RepID=A0A1H8LJI8_9GAMM|nr:MULTISPECIES: CbiX/SirB N-terminal domain-containing protein [Halomonas]MCP1304195.1 cobalamin biosynthesis protein CbiX [Halomonas sp. R1t8]MCP1330366.1 cobalamin biosynthesis protein CbiX [Halomonas sp. R1t4]NQY76726.1 cobalamin biosynthesis protein CbiX [Halomonas sp.]SEO05277.1 Sirohydrochlorin ferrochelatase [Halomonas aquamarina]